MLNVKTDVKGDTLTITVDLKQRHGTSKSQKTVTIASTEGNQKVGKGDITFGLNVYTKEGLTEAIKAAKSEE